MTKKKIAILLIASAFIILALGSIIHAVAETQKNKEDSEDFKALVERESKYYDSYTGQFSEEMLSLSSEEIVDLIINTKTFILDNSFSSDLRIFKDSLKKYTKCNLIAELVQRDDASEAIYNGYLNVHLPDKKKDVLLEHFFELMLAYEPVYNGLTTEQKVNFFKMSEVHSPDFMDVFEDISAVVCGNGNYSIN